MSTDEAKLLSVSNRDAGMPLREDESISASVAQVNKTSEDKNGVILKWVTAIAAVLAAVTGIASVFVAWAGVAETRDSTDRTTAAIHAAAVRADRTTVYSEYGDTLAVFSEFVWANLYWAGIDKVAEVPASFWPTAQDLQSTLEAKYTRAMMLVNDEEAEVLLQTLHSEQSAVFQKFKCQAGQQESECTDSTGILIKPATNLEIQQTLYDWSASFGQVKLDLIDVASRQLE